MTGNGNKKSMQLDGKVAGRGVRLIIAVVVIAC